ncbi:hypothetical protein CANCADRAFT_58627 [Tortispora caseinolytica NRRL Y-17796]|uniref:LsmAD domain-containing protein n=1 Tax=Tortispora caseinolytica NRRL Y-17796 TaxID=767744 RepID=A0A1E4TDF4_9ASCO|nr:hypothetical protein CANCADRAFT_58627 [Tortispora caseinolytica NRRL Y-17796]
MASAMDKSTRKSVQKHNKQGSTSSVPKSLSSPAVKSSSSPSNGSSTRDTFKPAMHARILQLLGRTYGKFVTATTRTGESYHGILTAAETEAALGVTLALATKLDASPDDMSIPNLIIQPEDLAFISISKPDLRSHEASASIRTDTDISRTEASLEAKFKELQPWKPDSDTPMISLEDSSPSSATKWDQFAANEKLFGVKSTYNEDFYTTKIDRTGADYKEREERAAQLAKEIESSADGGDRHIREERLGITEGEDIDEEDLYSGVKRDADPSLQTAQASSQAAKQDLPQDPAIITSKNAVPAKKDNTRIPNQDQFLKFATAERENLMQRQRAAQANHRVRNFSADIDELKQFSKSFKVPGPVPPDMVSIIQKNKAASNDNTASYQFKTGDITQKPTVPSPLHERANTRQRHSPSKSNAKPADMRPSAMVTPGMTPPVTMNSPSNQSKQSPAPLTPRAQFFGIDVTPPKCDYDFDTAFNPFLSSEEKLTNADIEPSFKVAPSWLLDSSEKTWDEMLASSQPQPNTTPMFVSNASPVMIPSAMTSPMMPGANAQAGMYYAGAPMMAPQMFNSYMMPPMQQGYYYGMPAAPQMYMVQPMTPQMQAQARHGYMGAPQMMPGQMPMNMNMNLNVNMQPGDPGMGYPAQPGMFMPPQNYNHPYANNR